MDFIRLNKLYRDNGAVLVKEFLNKEQTSLIKSAIQFCVSKPSPFSSKIAKDADKESKFFHDYWTYNRNDYVKTILRDKSIIEKIKKITGNKKVNFFHDHILVKNPNSPITPWHHDRPYYFIDGPNNFSIWITPDDVKEDNSLAFCAGSHKSNKIYVPVDFNDISQLSNDPNLSILDEDALNKESENGILIFKMSPGDAIFFHNRTLHRSLPSSSNSSRSALSLRMIGDGAFLTKVCCTNPQPPFHKFGMKLEEKKPVDSEKDWFPELPL